MAKKIQDMKQYVSDLLANGKKFDTYGQCTPDGKLLPQVKTLPGIKYDARAGNMYEQIKKMLDIPIEKILLCLSR